MAKRHFRELLDNQFAQRKFVSVGLDSDYARVPGTAPGLTVDPPIYFPELVSRFNENIVEATADIAGVYKPNIAFYAGHSIDGLVALKQTIKFIHQFAPEVPVILDAKRGDIDNTNLGYVREAFQFLDADAITLNGYMGGLSLSPFLELEHKGLFVLCRTSNLGSDEFQELPVRQRGGSTMPLYQIVARNFARRWNKKRNCGLVVGAPYPAQLKAVRALAPTMPILIPGVGAQAGDLEGSVNAGLNYRKKGIVVNSSRGIIFASKGPDYAQAARDETFKLHDAINKLL